MKTVQISLNSEKQADASSGKEEQPGCSRGGSRLLCADRGAKD